MLSTMTMEKAEAKLVEPVSIAPKFQDTVFVIMWWSKKSGGTYSDIRKSEAGKDRFLRTLEYYGYDMSLVQVFEQTKPWVPEPKARKPLSRKKDLELQ